MVALIECVAATAIWSSSFVVSQIGLRYMGPFTVVGLQYLVAFVALSPLVAQDVRAAGARSSRGLWMQLLALGLTAYVIGNGTLIWGLKWIPAATAALLLSASPLLVMIGASIWLKEPPVGEQIAGIGLTVVGMLGLAVGTVLRWGGSVEAATAASGAATGVAFLLGFALLGRVLWFERWRRLEWRRPATIEEALR
jgi:drug/metabolite transporter (DMT)-like permease